MIRASGLIDGNGAWLLGLVLLVSSAGCAGPGTRHEVGIRNFAYEPSVIEVEEGDSIIWTNEDLVPHTATAIDGSWDSGSVEAHESRGIEAGPAGRHEYLCAFHPGMRAVVIVRG